MWISRWFLSSVLRQFGLSCWKHSIKSILSIFKNARNMEPQCFDRLRVEWFQHNWTICWHKKHPFGFSLSVGPFFLSLRILSVASTAFATSANLKTIKIQSYIFFELNIQRDHFSSLHIFLIWTFHAALWFKIISSNLNLVSRISI